jgi:hypothetical protein
VLQRGRLPSHLSFLFLHIMQARRLGFGTSALLGGWGAEEAVPAGALASTWTVTDSSASSTPFMAVSVSGDVDMVTAPRMGPRAWEDRMGVPQRRVASGAEQRQMRRASRIETGPKRGGSRAARWVVYQAAVAYTADVRQVCSVQLVPTQYDGVWTDGAGGVRMLMGGRAGLGR